MHSNDDRKPLPADAALYTLYSTQGTAAEEAGSATNITEWMKEEIINAGFTNVHERHFKLPIGDWPKHPVYKEAGRLAKLHMYEGIEGWCMWLLTKYGSPKPWSPEEVLAYCAKMKSELDQGCHIFQWHRRVWAQKPYAEDSEKRTSA